MELEERVKILEGEIKILKNEIQSTLLDIQEQILSHYYPVLRMAESAPPDGVTQSLESIRAEQRKRELTKETPTLPKTKRVTLDEIRAKAAPEETPVSPKEKEDEEPSQPEEETDPDTIMELAEWLNDSVEKIGGERTSKLIEGYVTEKHIAPDVEDVLIGLISLSDNGNPPERVRMTEMLDVILKLNKILNLKQADIAMALSLIEEE